MKKQYLYLYITILITLISGNQNVFGQWSEYWHWSTGKPWGDDTRFIQYISATEWIGLGFNGGLIKTTDAGNTWTTRSDVTDYTGWNPPNIRDGWFFDSNTGFAVGNLSSNGIISKTTNGGNSWTNFQITSTTFNSIYFLDNNTGYAVGNVGNAFKTTNGGTSWFALTVGSSLSLNGVFALDANNIYAVSQSGRFFKSTDGGSVWNNSATSLTSTLYSVIFKNTDTGFVGGSSGSFQFTSDGGATWTLRPAPSTPNLLKDMVYNDPEILAVGDENYLYRTTDYGTTWSALNFSSSAPPGNVTSAMYSIDKTGNNILISGFLGLIYNSTDDGSTWTTQSVVNHDSFLQGLYASSMNGKIWAVGLPAPTSVLYSSNGGADWDPEFGGARYGNYRDVEFLDDNTGYICGEGGTILRTSDGGASWDSVTNTTTQAANCIEIAGDNNVFVGCNSSFLFRSTNAGLNFTQTSIGSTNNQVNGLSFTDENTGWAVVSRNILKTTDAGLSWNTQYTHVTTLLSISMANENIGYACGWAGSLFKTTNGGINWVQLASQIPTNLTKVDFVNINNGFVVSGGGLGVPGSAMKTNNGGASWQIVNAGSNPLFNVKVLHPDSAITLGFANILKYMAPSSAYKLNLTMNFELCPMKDTLFVELRSSVSPFNLIETRKGTGGQGTAGLFSFLFATNGTPYYLAVKNRNSITTWTSAPVSFSGNALSYDFTSAQSQAYGNNQSDAGGLWSYYQGDINQDEQINLTDILEVYNASSNYVTGPYVLTDLNCDGFVDLSDIIPTFNNSSAFISVQKP